VAEAKAKLQEAESRGKDSEKLTERLATLERERDEARRTAAMARMEKTPEFKEKWERPFNEAAEYARELITQFSVETAEGRKPADWEKDFGSVYNLPYEAAEERATALFGANRAPVVMRQYEELHKLERVASKAWEAEKGQYNQREQERVANAAKEQEAFKAAHKSTTDGWIRKYPDMYGDDPSDPKVAEIFKQGLEAVDELPQTFAQMVAKRTRNRLDAAAAPRLRYELGKVRKELAAMKAKMENGAASRPGGGKSGGGGGGGDEGGHDMTDPKNILAELNSGKR
jgi:ribosomal protein L29